MTSLGADAGCWYPAMGSDGSVLRPDLSSPTRRAFLAQRTRPMLVDALRRLGHQGPIPGPAVHLLGLMDGAVAACDLALACAGRPLFAPTQQGPPEEPGGAEQWPPISSVVLCGDVCLEEELAWWMREGPGAKKGPEPCGPPPDEAWPGLVLARADEGARVPIELVRQKMAVLRGQAGQGVRLEELEQGANELQHGAHRPREVVSWPYILDRDWQNARAARTEQRPVAGQV